MNSVKKRFTSGSSSSPTKQGLPDKESFASSELKTYEGVSPELVPIVTLLSSQAHRRYHEGIFMLYYDLNGDGKPADREWKEVYGILTGNQLAYWDAANLAEFRNNPSMLFELSSKPNYINFTDSVYNAVRSLPAAKQNLDNVIIVSTTLKNRYIIQFKTYKDMASWYLALRLSNFEYSALQEAYTGALLSAKGSKLSDIRTILAEKRFDHEDWVGIRYGSGMAWKRCYAVIEPSVSKKNSFTPGRMLFYENEQKKKKQLMAVVMDAHSVSATYPQSHLLIEQSTMLKIDAHINFKSPSLSSKVSKKSSADFRRATIFLMPEQHSAVPGFDTLIRFLMPMLDSFGLYGRPKRLKADRVDPNSLLYGLPILPNVHYLNNSDIDHLASNASFLDWSAEDWKSGIKAILKSKLDKGYDGCGSKRGVAGAVTSLNSPRNASSSTFKQSPQVPSKSTFSSSSDELKHPVESQKNTNVKNLKLDVNGEKNPNLVIPPPRTDHHSVELAEIYHKYSEIKSPSDQFHVDRSKLLNGSDEKLNEFDLPTDFRKMSLEESNGIYPKDDNFLDNDNSFDEISDDDSLNVGGLAVPNANYRNSSYSSVHSPMTQYNEFNKQFNATVDKSVSHPTEVVNDSDEEYDADAFIKPSTSPMRRAPNQISKSNPSFSLSESINRVPQGINSPDIESDSRDHLSIHSESGKVISGDSSPNSQVSLDQVPKSQPQGAYKPKYISSPNTLQNQKPKFNSENPTIVAPSHGYQVAQTSSYNSPGRVQQNDPTSNYPPQPRENAMKQGQFNARPSNDGGYSGAPTQVPTYQSQNQNQNQNLRRAPPPPAHTQQPMNGYNSQQGRSGQYPQSSQFGPRRPSGEAHQNYPPQNNMSSSQMPPQYKQNQMNIPPSDPYRKAPVQQNTGIPPSVTYQSMPQQNHGGYPRSNHAQMQQRAQTGIPPSVSNQPSHRPMYGNPPPPQGQPQSFNRPNQGQVQGQQMPRYQGNNYGQASSSLRSFDSPNQQQYRQVPPNAQQPQYNPNQYQQQSQQSRHYNQNGMNDYPVNRYQ